MTNPLVTKNSRYSATPLTPSSKGNVMFTRRPFFGRMLASWSTVAVLFTMASWSNTAFATDLCVTQGGTSGCYSSIDAAIAAAAVNDTIRVREGIYREDVTIGKPLTLIGAGEGRSIIDATGKPNGVYVDGLDNPGLSTVGVSGFMIENANFEGILVTNASSITVADNQVMNNDRSLQPASSACPGVPSFETEEGSDCGEGIHLSGVHQSTVAMNIVEHNAGGILLSDDTGPTYSNLISGNEVGENPFDCGITLASHPPASLTGSSNPLGLWSNTITGNHSFRNGLGEAGAGAGVGIFDSVPGASNRGNVVVGNRLNDNGLPGVALHSHTPGQNLNDNTIVGNVISGNGKDTGDAATPGTTGINLFGVSPITGTTIAYNSIRDEADDVAISTPAQVDVHFNGLLGNGIGVDNLGGGIVNATENWWGCVQGPSSGSCSRIAGPGVPFTPWQIRPLQ
jgi:parallel beta-helix repeat protein